MTGFKPEHVFKAISMREFVSCHASTVLRMIDGRTMVACFGGRERSPDSAIYASVKDKNWSRPRQMAKVSDVAHWNPVLFYDANARIHLFFKVGPSVEAWQTYVMTLEAPGDEWTAPKLLKANPPDGGRGPVRSRPIILESGTWLAPASVEVGRGRQAIWDAFVDRSEDEGKTWEKSDLITFDRSEYTQRGGVIQPTLWESSPGRVHMLLRSTAHELFRSDSEDGGKTWTQAEPTGIPNPNSGVDVCKRPDGLLCLAYNPCAGNWIRRSPISVAFSVCEGRKWSDPVHIEGEVGEQKNYSYPSLDFTDKGFVLTYTQRRKNIGYIELDVKVNDVQNCRVDVDVTQAEDK